LDQNPQKPSIFPAVIWTPSPNFDDRPDGAVIDMVIVHYTDMETAADSLQLLTDPAAKVSAHYLIDYDGTIYHLVEDRMRAWHAGVSSWQGQVGVNARSIGVELQNGGKAYFDQQGEWQPYPLNQMQALTLLVNALATRHPIKKEFILGHNQVAPDRKIDPGPHFDWNFLLNNLQFN
jgi:N-acetylmuramoyl-L-alanine amidase